MRRSLLVLGLMLTTATMSSTAARATTVADVTRFAGARTNVMTGMGLVTGLKGTGDGGGYLPAIKPLAGLLARYGNPVAAADLANANTVAIVMVSATMRTEGAVSGDHLDVTVTSVGAATSLRGGHLWTCPLLGPTGKPATVKDAAGNLVTKPFAFAAGPVEADPATPTAGTVLGGATMETDLPTRYVDRVGRFTLVLDDPSASWAMANAIEQRINQWADTGSRVAAAVDPKNVIVLIPPAERDQPDTFIASVLALQLPDVPTEARVRINTKTGTMIVSGDAEIRPVVISHPRVTITIGGDGTTAGQPTRRGGGAAVTAGGTRLRDLAAAFDQMKVPAQDRIEIVEELRQMGKLQVKMTVDGAEK